MPVFTAALPHYGGICAIFFAALWSLGGAGSMVLAVGGCVSEDAAGSGTVELVLSGGQALREGFPYTEGDDLLSFSDDWTMAFEKYIVSVGHVKLSDPASGDVEAEWPGVAVVDLMRSTQAERALASVSGVPARRLDVEFETLAAHADADVVDADAADVAEMAERSWSLLLEGSATRQGKTVRFRVGLPAHATYRRCANGVDGTQGLAVQSNKTTQALLSTHVVHLFWDHLLGEAEMRFDAWAAVAGEDQVVTEQELFGQDLFFLKGEDGERLLAQDGQPVLYDDGGLLPTGETTLADFARYGAILGMHFNGLGFCEYSATSQE